MPKNDLDKLRSRKPENCRAELETPLFSDGHVVGMFWENVALGIVERAHRDAEKLNVPLYCLHATDQREAFKNKDHDQQVTHSLQTVPNIHRTGKRKGLLLLPQAMLVRVSDVLAPLCGPVKDKIGRVISGSRGARPETT